MIEIEEMSDNQLIMLMLIKIGYNIHNDSLVNALIKEMEKRLNRSYDEK